MLVGTSFRRPSQEVPPAPRDLTAEMRRDAAVSGKFLRMFGGIWAGVAGLVALVFAVLSVGDAKLALAVVLCAVFGSAGLLLWLLGSWMRGRAADVFKNGVEARGEIVDVFRDYMVRMNGQHPWRVKYTFISSTGEPTNGTATFWQEDRPRGEKGQRVVLLHHPDSPARSVLWTRLDGTDEAPPSG